MLLMTSSCTPRLLTWKGSGAMLVLGWGEATAGAGAGACTGAWAGAFMVAAARAAEMVFGGGRWPLPIENVLIVRSNHRSVMLSEIK